MKDMKEVRGLVGKLVSGLFIVVLLLCAVLAVLCPSAFAATTWSKTYGGAKAEGHSGGAVVDSIYPYVMQTSDGGFLLTGDTSSFGAGSNDAYLVKTDANGVVQWQKTYGGPLNESACMVWPTNDGGYAIAAITNSYGAGGHDAWLLKTDATGNLQWNKTYGGTGEDMAWIVWQTADGGYIIGGSTTSFGAGSHDAWLTKTDANGNMLWNKTYGAAGSDDVGQLIPTADGGYLIVCYTTSFGGYKGWLFKTDSAGTLQWNKTYGIGTVSWFDLGTQTADGGYAFAGVTYPTAKRDAWLVKTDASGNMLWNKTYGGTDDDSGFSVMQTDDGGYLVQGNTASFGAGGQDGWLVKTDASGNMLWNKTYGGAGNEFIDIIIRTSDGGYAMAGYTDSFGAGSTDLWLIKTDSNFVSTIPVSPSASAFSSVTVLSGWTWWFFVHSNGGVVPYTYQWYEGTTLLQGQTSMVLSVTKNTPGTYAYFCKVTDSAGTAINSNAVYLTVR